MNKLLKTLTATTLAIGLFFQCNLVFADAGFYPLDHERVPESIRQQRSSVFRIFPAKFLGNIPAAEMIARESLVKEHPEIPDDIKRWMLRDIYDCKESGDETCPKYSYAQTNGTASLLGNTSTLVTAAHVVLQFYIAVYHTDFLKLSMAERRGFIRQNSCSFFAEDESGNLVYRSPHKDKNIVFIGTTANNRSRDENERREWNIRGQYLDVAVIHLHENIDGAKPFLLADEGSTEVDFLQALSYPSTTSGRESLGAPDSPGGELRYTHGQRIGYQDLMRQRGMPEELVELIQKPAETVFYANIDGVPGGSGKLILNESGEVLGVFSSAVSSDGNIKEAYSGGSMIISNEVFREHI